MYVFVSFFDIFSTGNSRGIPIEGRCIGYAHRVVLQRRSYVESSEVFEYDYAGEHYESVNEAFHLEPDAEIGETVTLRVDSCNSSEVFILHRAKAETPVISLWHSFKHCGRYLSLCIGIKRSDQNDIHDQITNANEKHVLTDAVIEEKIGDNETPQDISLYNVVEKYEVYYLHFSNDPLISTDKEKWDKYELNDTFYIVRNSGTGNLIAVFNYKEWDYHGAHPILDMRE